MISSAGDSRLLRIAWSVLFAAATLWVAALATRGAALAPDEIEFFRATKWIGDGQIPFRDFWEHHTPLQWILFAPIARFFARGPGVDAIVVMRWAQLPLWIGIFYGLARLARLRIAVVVPALALLLTSRTFIDRALEYRVDVAGNFFAVAALAVAVLRPRRSSYVLFGVLMSLAVLANMRMVPLAVIAALLLLVRSEDGQRWRWNAAAFWLVAGVVIAAAAFILWLMLTGAWSPFADAMFDYNRQSGSSLDVHTFDDALLAPFRARDIGGSVYWTAALVGFGLAVRRIRTPGVLQLLALLSAGAILSLALMDVQYDYHLQTVWLLLFPLVAQALASLPAARWSAIALVVTTIALTVYAAEAAPDFGTQLEYQDIIMRAADRLTEPDEAVFDGAGQALRRAPAYRYWFLTTGVRLLADQRVIDPYDVDDALRNPPAAVIFDYRLAIYLEHFPRLAGYLVRHYVPVYRNLWVAGRSMPIAAGTNRIEWRAPRAGTYQLVVSEPLARHPWITGPLDYARLIGPRAARYAIPLHLLPSLDAASIDIRVDGRDVDGRILRVDRGSRVTIVVTHDRPAGLLLVPSGIEVLALAPAEDFVF